MNINSILQQIQTIQKNKWILTQNRNTLQIAQFMKKWYAFACNQTRKQQYSYAWSLNHNYPLDQLTQNIIIQDNSFITQQIEPKTSSLSQQQDLIALQSYKVNNEIIKIIFTSQNQVIIAQTNHIFLINPSLRHLESLKNIKSPLIIILLTSANIIQLINFYILKTSLVKINIKDIYVKFNMLVNLIQLLTREQQSQQNRFNRQAYILKQDEYFEYGSILWMARQNCWFQPTYDLIFIVNDNNNKINFLVQQSKINETKLIYYGWKKTFITEQSYQYYIKQWPLQLKRGQKGLVYQAINKKTKQKRNKNDLYLRFAEKELIQKLNNEQRDEIFHCCQLIQLIPNQIISKANLLFDYLYILIQGQFTVNESKCPIYTNGKANIKQMYGLQQLKQRQQRYLFTLQSNSHATLFRILKNNVSFILYDFL